ncbi:MAG: ABC transporter ATP-binding protein [Saprospiraceae bacterium]
MEIRIENLGKRFQHGWVFKNLSRQFNSNKVYGIAGRNGSGKSTFLRIVSGLLSPTNGSVIYYQDSKNILRENIYQYVNVAAPYTDLLEEFTLTEMIQFHTSFKPSDQLKTVSDWLTLMELEHAFKRPIFQFSSGMKQRARLALALYTPGEILFLDEPTSNLDEEAKAWFFHHLDTQRKNKIVFVASNETEDFRFCDEMIRLA